MESKSNPISPAAGSEQQFTPSMEIKCPAVIAKFLQAIVAAVVFCNPCTIRPDAYRIEGHAEQQFNLTGKKREFLFRVETQESQWRIRTKILKSPASDFEHTESGYDGTNLYTLIKFRGTSVKGDTYIVAKSSGTVREGNDPPFGHDLIAQLWLGFASRSFLKTNTAESLPCSVIWNGGDGCRTRANYVAHENDSFALKRAVTFHNGEAVLVGGRRMRLGHPFSDGYTNSLFIAEDFRQNGDRLVPMFASYAALDPKENARTTADLKTAWSATFKVTNIMVLHGSAFSPRPEMIGQTYIQDFRTGTNSAAVPYIFYYSTNNWLQPVDKAFGSILAGERDATPITFTRAKMFLAGIAGTSVLAMLAIPVLRKNSRTQVHA